MDAIDEFRELDVELSLQESLKAEAETIDAIARGSIYHCLDCDQLITVKQLRKRYGEKAVITETAVSGCDLCGGSVERLRLEEYLCDYDDISYFVGDDGELHGVKIWWYAWRDRAKWIDTRTCKHGITTAGGESTTGELSQKARRGIIAAFQSKFDEAIARRFRSSRAMRTAILKWLKI